MAHAVAPTTQTFERHPFVRSSHAPPALQDLIAFAENEISERNRGNTWAEPLSKTTNTSNYDQLVEALKRFYPEVDGTYEPSEQGR